MERAFRILGISSGRVMGNAEVLLKESLMECERLADVDVRMMQLRELNLKSCDGCLKCVQERSEGGEGACPVKDDFNWLKEQILWADAIIFAVPCFCYIPSSEVFKLMNRAMGAGQSHLDACRKNPKLVGLICDGGSDTVDFHLPMQYYALHQVCPGFELVDQFYANWCRGKGYVVYQEQHLKRARQLAVRMTNRLKGYQIPPVRTTITKLNPMEHTDDRFIHLEGCPVCHGAVVKMSTEVFENGKFQCAVCGSKGHVEYHGGDLTYVWEDEPVAHNALTQEQDRKYLEAYQKAHKAPEGPKAELVRFPVLTPDNDPPAEKPRIIAVVDGPKNGTSEILAQKALEAATADGQFEGAVLQVHELNILPCSGCLTCKTNARYHGITDECVIRDDDLWALDKILASQGILFSMDCAGGFTYDKIVAMLQRFGRGIVMKKYGKKPYIYGTMIASFDEQAENASYVSTQFYRSFFDEGPQVVREYFTAVPLTGDGILADAAALSRAMQAGTALKNAAAKYLEDERNLPLIRPVNGVCPSCGLNLIELRSDMTAACSLCDADGQFEHIFGENVITWNEYSVRHSRTTRSGARLHFKHINFSQSEENAVLENPDINKEALAPYLAYDRLVKP